MTSFTVHRAVHCIRSGGLIAYPTEAVYGLGCDPFNAEAVDRLLLLKQRSVEKGLILVAANCQQVREFLPDIHPDQLQQLEQSTLLKPLTGLVADAGHTFPPWIKGKHSKVAIRICQHPIVEQLCLRLGMPIVSTSANKSGFAPATTPLQVRQQIGSGLDYLLVAPLGGAVQPSRILDLGSNRILRR